jgi:hypothetical protein
MPLLHLMGIAWANMMLTGGGRRSAQSCRRGITAVAISIVVASAW